MKRIPVSRLSNEVLLKELEQSVAQDGPHTARQVALVAEVERRRLYAPAGYPSMYTYCVGRLHLSDDAAYKRIRVARAASRFPGILAALAEGRVHLSGLTLLSHQLKHLTTETANELIAVMTHKSKREIEQLLAERFPKVDVRAEVRKLAQLSQTVTAPADASTQPQTIANTESELAPGPVRDQVILCQSRTGACAPRDPEPARVAPLSPQRFGVQFTLDQAGHDLLRDVQNLLGNQVAPGDLAEVVVRALTVLKARLEKQKFAATERPAQNHRPRQSDSRHIPSRVKRAVWKRDGGQCTYVSETGKRCESRWDLEFDHQKEYARGGDASVSNIRLRCRAHNQYAAELSYGQRFMENKRAAAAPSSA